MNPDRCADFRHHAGFTLIEMLLVVVLIGIVTSVAIPSVVRARGAAMEASTIASLRLIHGAQAAYATSCASGFYAPSIPWLSRAPASGGPAFIGREFTTDTTDRQGYRIRFSAGPRAATAPRTCNGLAPRLAVRDFFVEAGPIMASAGLVTRYFGVMTAGTIYQSTRRVRPIFTGTPPPPARPIQ
mgnify:CR=1 FL=1